MKTLFTSLAISAALLSINQSHAQQSTPQPCKQPSPEAQLISSKHQDGETITKWLVQEGSCCESNEFFIRYKINLSNLSPDFSNNSVELEKLNQFISSISGNELKKIKAIDVVGYASPDGVKSQNEQLAQKRAMSLRNYIAKSCNVDCCNGETKGVALPWKSIDKSIESSHLNSKQNIINIVDSNMSQAAIEDKLRQSNGWDYIRTAILPKMRHVDVTVHYDNYKVVVTRTPDLVINMIEVEKERGATVAYVEEVVIADSPYDNRPPTVVDKENFIIVIDNGARSTAEFIATDYPKLDY